MHDPVATLIAALAAQVYTAGERMPPDALRFTAQALEDAAEAMEGKSAWAVARRAEALEASLAAERLADCADEPDEPTPYPGAEYLGAFMEG